VSAAADSALVKRRAIRRYLPQPVSDDLVREILTEARWAPSATNTQSTYVYVLSGGPFEQFKADLRKYSEDNIMPVSDIDMSPKWTPKYEARMKELFETRSSFVAAEEAKAGVAPPANPVHPMVAAAEIFGAPIMLILAFDKDISFANGIFDGGLLAQSVCLAAHEHDLGTCIVGGAVRYSELVRKAIPGLEDKNILAGIALGYPDWDAPINRFPRTRVPVDEFATFVR
jgi:nitroreductase